MTKAPMLRLTLILICMHPQLQHTRFLPFAGGSAGAAILELLPGALCNGGAASRLAAHPAAAFRSGCTSFELL